MAFILIIMSMVLGERKMANIKFSERSSDDFAQKCRAALEKSWGIDIPAPNSLGKKGNSQKK
jgi:hypothetical protein